MTKRKNIIKCVLSLIIIFSVSFFYYEAFQRNWESIQSHPLNLNLFFISLSFLSLVITCLCSTYGWHLALNTLSNTKKMTFAQSVAMVNTSSLTKYIPGKVWSYAIQMYWLVRAGFPKSLILYVNFINLSISIITSLIVGFCYLSFSFGSVPYTIPCLLVLIGFDICFIKFNSSIVNGMISLFNRVLDGDIEYFSISQRLLVCLHSIHFLAAFCFGLGAYVLCSGIGVEVGAGSTLVVMASLLLADVVGFLAVIVPGGLGVREGVMYLMLNNVSVGTIALLLPLASRIVSMVVDAALGIFAFILLRGLKEYR